MVDVADEGGGAFYVVAVLAGAVYRAATSVE
jgi:hypothetical protein